MQFLDGASVEKKLAAIFFYLNNGEPVSAVMISKLLPHVYPQTKDVCSSLIDENVNLTQLLIYRMKSKHYLYNSCDN